MANIVNILKTLRMNGENLNKPTYRSSCFGKLIMVRIRVNTDQNFLMFHWFYVQNLLAATIFIANLRPYKCLA